MIIGADRTEKRHKSQGQERVREREYGGESDIIKDRTVGQIKAKDRAKKKRREKETKYGHKRVDLMDIERKEEEIKTLLDINHYVHECILCNCPILRFKLC